MNITKKIQDDTKGLKIINTTLKISDTASEDLRKLVASWKAKNKKEAIEKMILYFKKLGLDPSDEIPETMGKKVMTRVDQIIRFYKENEKRQAAAMENIVLAAQRVLNKQGNTGTNKEWNDILRELERLHQQQLLIEEILKRQNDLLIQRLTAFKDAAALLEWLKKALLKYTEDVIQNKEQWEGATENSPYFQRLIQVLEKNLHTEKQ